jgi:hypothetical protein
MSLAVIGSIPVTNLGDDIAKLVEENHLSAVSGVMYLPGGEAPPGMETIFCSGAYQLVGTLPARNGKVPRWIAPINEAAVPQNIRKTAATLTTPTFFGLTELNPSQKV